MKKNSHVGYPRKRLYEYFLISFRLTMRNVRVRAQKTKCAFGFQR